MGFNTGRHGKCRKGIGYDGWFGLQMRDGGEKILPKTLTDALVGPSHGGNT